MNKKTVLITGANRGIGFEFAKQYAEDGWDVFAGIRSDTKELQNLIRHHNITIVKLDLNNLQKCKENLHFFLSKPLHLLINNAGVYGSNNQSILDDLTEVDFFEVFQVNTIAPFLLTQFLLPTLRKGDKIIVNITSRMGSIEDNSSGGSYIYRASKAALNAVMKSMQIDLAEEGFKVLLLHPGSVKTDMGGKHALIEPEESVRNMRRIIENAHQLENQFYHYQGDELPW
ncbi:MAG TPA: SDR family oxidoreductase [Gammaproteobacteria bacterium]|nr:SDR family oxidoreductase [Gammaproteobacteria bacterium]